MKSTALKITELAKVAEWVGVKPSDLVNLREGQPGRIESESALVFRQPSDVTAGGWAGIKARMIQLWEAEINAIGDQR